MARNFSMVSALTSLVATLGLITCGDEDSGGGEVCGNANCGAGENVSNCCEDCGGCSSGGGGTGGGGTSSCNAMSCSDYGFTCWDWPDGCDGYTGECGVAGLGEDCCRGRRGPNGCAGIGYCGGTDMECCPDDLCIRGLRCSGGMCVD